MQQLGFALPTIPFSEFSVLFYKCTMRRCPEEGSGSMLWTSSHPTPLPF